MSAITYELTSVYYTDVARFTDRLLDKAARMLPSVRPYAKYLHQNQIEAIRSDEQYQMELLMLGVYWRNYHTHASAVSRRTADLCHGLLAARKQPERKAFVDELRGVVNTTTLLKKDPHAPIQLTVTGLKKLVLWLSATGDFAEEATRLTQWQQFLQQQPTEKQSAFLRASQSLAAWFEPHAAEALGTYTQNVSRFLRSVPERYANREDIVLCSRKESDYHLIMTGAEIMNRALQSRFRQTRKQIVLLPACMRPVDHNCRATGDNTDLHCVGCNTQCAVGALKHSGDSNLDVRVIVHSSNFTAILQKWKNQPDVGLIASACILHLFTGGFEMQKLNIPSQCVLLNYAGCKNHWHPTGIPTTIDYQQLSVVLGKVPASSSSIPAAPTPPQDAEMPAPQASAR